METNFYELSQNNSGGSHDCDETVCARMIIEATSIDEAISKAEELGCYWDGVYKDIDCSCCGDRWYQPYGTLDIENINTKWGGYELGKYLDKSDDKDKVIEEFKLKYPNANWLTEPEIVNKYGSEKVIGKIEVDSIERYGQIMANEYGGWTSPDVRIFYKNGDVSELFKNK